MNKTKVLRVYTVLTAIIGVVLFVYSLIYVSNFTEIELGLSEIAGEFYGNVDKTLFNLTFSIYGDELVVFNNVLVIGLALFVLNLIFVFVIGNTESVEDESLRVVHQTNIIVYMTYLFAFALFYILIPDKINGPIESYFVFVKMPILSDNIRYVINLMNVTALFLVVFNFGTFLKTLPESEVDEELYAEEFFSYLEEEESEDDLDDLDDIEEVDEK